MGSHTERQLREAKGGFLGGGGSGKDSPQEVAFRLEKRSAQEPRRYDVTKPVLSTKGARTTAYPLRENGPEVDKNALPKHSCKAEHRSGCRAIVLPSWKTAGHAGTRVRL